MKPKYAINFERIPDLLVNDELKKDLKDLSNKDPATALLFLYMVLIADEKGRIESADDELLRRYLNKNIGYLKGLLQRLLK